MPLEPRPDSTPARHRTQLTIAASYSPSKILDSLSGCSADEQRSCHHDLVLQTSAATPTSSGNQLKLNRFHVRLAAPLVRAVPRTRAPDEVRCKLIRRSHAPHRRLSWDDASK